MATARRKRVYERVDVLTPDQELFLETGLSFGDAYPFEDAAHEQYMWSMYGAQIMEAWFAEPLVAWAGRRPLAFWRFDHGIQPPRWPKRIVNEAHAVLRLCNPTEAEIAEIEQRGLLKRTAGGSHPSGRECGQLAEQLAKAGMAKAATELRALEATYRDLARHAYPDRPVGADGWPIV